MKADRIRGLSQLGDECESVGRQLARLLSRAQELADAMPAGTPEERDETIAEARRFVGDTFLSGVGNQMRPVFRKAIGR